MTSYFLISCLVKLILRNNSHLVVEDPSILIGNDDSIKPAPSNANFPRLQESDDGRFWDF